MKKIWMFITLTILLSYNLVYAGDKWDKTDLSLLAASTLLLAVDWQQTRTIANNPDKYYERGNFLIGKHPSQQTVDLYCAAALLTEIVVAELLPSKWRKIWLSGWIGVEGVAVTYNYSIGIRF